MSASPDPIAAVETAETVPQLLEALRAASPAAEATVVLYLDLLRLQARIGGPLFTASVLLVAREFCGKEPNA